MANDPTPIVRVSHLSAAYAGGGRALEDVSFNVQAGERIAIIGPNGAGKSTLLKCLIGLLPLQAGNIEVVGKVGYVPQDAGVDWTFPVTVREAVLMARTRQIGWFKRAGAADWRAVDGALERVGLTPFAQRQVGALSGGQQQRALIARALAGDATVLALDEPFSGVDPGAQEEIMSVLRNLHSAGMTILLCTHDLDLAFSAFDRVLALRHSVVCYGKAAEVSRKDVLTRLYGASVPTYADDEKTIYYVDDHHEHGHGGHGHGHQH